MIDRSLPAAWLAMGLATFVSAPALAAQATPADSTEDAAPTPLHERLADWNQDTGTRWASYTDRATGDAEMVYGGRLATGVVPGSDASWFELAREMVRRTSALTGLDADTLVADRVQFLPLAQMGSRDKWTVRFTQAFDGREVMGAAVNVLFDDEGAMLSVQTTAAVDRPLLSGVPAVSADGAAQAAGRAFRDETGLPAVQIGAPELLYGQVDGDRSRETLLVWRVGVQWLGRDTAPVGREIWIDARTGRAVASQNSVHHFDVSGTVVANSTPGIAPDTASNPEQAFPVPYVLVTSSQGNAITDANGDFTIPGATGPLDVSVSLTGNYANVLNSAGANISATQSMTGSGNVLTLNTSPTEQTTAQTNAYRGTNQLRDWIRSINPTDNTADFQARMDVNLNSTCNAFFDGVRTGYYLSGNDGFGHNCPNTAYSSVIAHEMGHWLNVRYGTGNGSDGMGEGNADVFALYLFDTPINGVDFLNPGQDLRTGLNTRQYCGDGNGGCYGGVHTDGEVWMGAAWKIRARLNVSLGDSMGDFVADNLFLGWMNAYDQTQITSLIEAQWLTLDDVDGNIFNGTPHFSAIDGGMRDQGFPGIDLQFFDFQDVTILGDTLNEAGPYAVDAEITHSFGGSVASASLSYRVNGGPWIATPMASINGTDWLGNIPGQVSPARVEYYLTANGGPSEVTDFPLEGADAPIQFVVGQRTQLLFDDFESDLGWTHDTYNDTSNNQDDWQRGVSAAKAGDATNAVSGSNIWGNDIGQGNWNGAYQNNVHTWLRSPIIDCTNATNTTLRFQRWLTVESGQYDRARIRVNGSLVWSNPTNGDLVDTAWTLQEVDISAFADGNPNVQIEFELLTDGGLTFGGWCLDDVEVYSIEPADSGCLPPVVYCTTSPNSAGAGAMISTFGSTSVAANNFNLLVAGAPANQFGLFFYGPEQDSVPFGQGTLCIGAGSTGLIRLTPAQGTDFVGSASRNVDFNLPPFDQGPGMVSAGEQWNFQFWYRDPGFGFNLSNAVSVTFCP